MTSQLKNTLLDVLERSIGRYVHNLDAENLNIGIWSGKIELNGMELNVDAINAELSRKACQTPDLAIPFRVLSGNFSSIQVDIPWTRITSKPVVFRAKGLSVFVEPYDHISVSANLSTDNIINKEMCRKRRMQEMDQADIYRESANAIRKLSVIGSNDETDNNMEDNTNSGSYASRLTQRIIENLQFDLEDVNISLKGFSCSAGVVLKSLSLYTTDQNGVRKFVDRKKDESFLFKTLMMNGLGIYCDQLKGAARNLGVNHPPEAFLLSPLFLQINLRLSDSHRCIDFPKFQVNSELPRLFLTLSQAQLKILNRIGQSLKATSTIKAPLFPEYRPDVPIQRNTVKLWWRYAFRCVGRISRKRSWTEFLVAFNKKKRYIPLYSRMTYHSSCPWLIPLSIEEEAELKQLHEDKSISIEGIMGYRNIVDAKIELEKKAHDETLAKEKANTSYFSSFFGSPVSESVELPIVSLTVDELKELESINMEINYVSDLSEDSWIYDVKFKLKSLQIDLLKVGPILSFSMNKVSTSFIAYADGTSETEFILSSMNIDDLTTNNTLFPSIMRSLESPFPSSFPNALTFKLGKKPNNGDSDLQIKMVAVEVVASPLVMIEVKNIFHNSDDFSKSMMFSKSALHPYVIETDDSGDEIFYDTMDDIPMRYFEDAEFPLIDAEVVTAAKNAISDTFAIAVNNAWNAKKIHKQNWIVDCDIHAPIIVLPERCSDPNANVLVFDLGKLSLHSDQSSDMVHEWFKSNVGTSDPLNIEHWKLEISKLSFILGQAGKQDWYADEKYYVSHRSIDISSSEAILEPLSVILSMGVEKKSDNTPKMCIFGVLPTFSVKFSPFQIVKILSVSNAWSNYSKEMSGKTNKPTKKNLPPPYKKPLRRGTSLPFESGIDAFDEMAESFATTATSLAPSSSTKADIVMHVSIALRKLSITVVTEPGKGLQAHLVSVVASTTKSSNGFSSNRLCMGWFWILDNLPSKLPRRQKLIAHSELPKGASYYAKNGGYKIMDELEKLGVFTDNYSGSSELADITHYLFSEQNIDRGIFNKEERDLLRFYSVYNSTSQISLIDAKFSSLYVNWNPQAVKNIMNMKASMLDLIDKSPSLLNAKSEHSLNGSGLSDLHESFLHSSLMVSALTDISASIMFIRAKMNKVQISLNSAKDDLLMFILTMAGTKVNLFSFSGSVDALITTIGMDDLRVETPTGRVSAMYNTVLGIAPNQSKSLLTVNYYKGDTAVGHCNLETLDPDVCDTCAQIELSPMRFVLLYNQIMTLSEYVTEGVLGALPAAAVVAAQPAAVEAVQPDDMEKIYHITAHGFDIFIPNEGSLTQYLALNVSNLVCQYRSLANCIGSDIQASFKKMSIVCDKDISLVDTPIEMKTSIFLPSGLDTDSIIIRTVDVVISRAFLLLSRSHYALMMSILSENIGGEDNYLRSDPDEKCLPDLVDEDVLGLSYNFSTTPHFLEASVSDNSEVSIASSPPNVLKRTVMIFKFDVLGLQLNNDDEYDPIIYLAAVETNITLRLLPDLEKMIIEMTLHNMTVEDRRIKTMGRYFRSIVSQLQHEANDDCKQDVFRLTYDKSYNGSRVIDFELGNPQVVIIPDILPDLYNFITIDEPEKEDIVKEESTNEGPYNEEQTTDDIEDMKVCLHYSENEIETSYGSIAKRQLITTKLTLKTLNCRFVMVDMGGEMLLDLNHNSTSKSGAYAEITETIVLQGKMNTVFETSSDALTGENYKRDLDVCCECIEIYVAQGHGLLYPIQILEPTSFSILFTTLMQNLDGQFITLKFYTPTSIDLTISMQNIALINAIVSSITDYTNDTDTEDEAHETKLLETRVVETSRKQALTVTFQEDNDDVRVADVSDSILVEDCEGAKSIVDSICTTSFAIILSQASLTIINDLQGLDQALLKFILQNTASKGEMISSEKQNDFRLNFDFTSIFLIDYFDISSNMWENFLLRPWELSLCVERKKRSNDRMLSWIDFDSNSCCISFSEQLLVSLGAASNMWSVYSHATKLQPTEQKAKSMNPKSKFQETVKRSIARSLVTSLPYGLKNLTGADVSFSIKFGNKTFEESLIHTCFGGQIEYFQFESSQSEGVGSKRLYGQDVKYHKSIEIHIDDDIIFIDHIDNELNNERKAHEVADLIVFSEVIRTGATTILCLSSQVKLHNSTILPFNITVQTSESAIDIGTCFSNWQKDKKIKASSRSVATKKAKLSGISNPLQSKSTALLSDNPSSLGIPIDMLSSYINSQDVNSKMTLFVSPLIKENVLNPNEPLSSDLLFCAPIDLPPIKKLIKMAQDGIATKIIEVPFKLCVKYEVANQRSIALNSSPDVLMVARVCIKVSLVKNIHPFVEVFIQPRTVLRNTLPANLVLRTLMPHTYSIHNGDVTECNSNDNDNEENHVLHQGDSLEVFTAGPSVNFSISYADIPILGPSLGWLDFVIPLGKDRDIDGPIQCILPLENSENEREEIDFLISKSIDIFENVSSDSLNESDESLSINDPPSICSEDQIRCVYFTSPNFAFDKTKDLCFEPVKSSGALADSVTTPNFLSSDGKCNITLLPDATKPLMLHKNINGDKKRKSLPFTVDDISICEGGIQSSPILWEDKTRSAYYVYRRFSEFNRSEIYIIPEFIIFNGSVDTFSVRQKNGVITTLTPGSIAPIFFASINEVYLAFEVPELAASTDFYPVDLLEMKLCTLYSNITGTALGSIPVQTVIGGTDSRLVITLGSITGNNEKDDMIETDQGTMFSDDCFDFHISLSVFKVTLKDTQLKNSVAQLCLKRLKVQYKKAFNVSNVCNSVENSEFSFSLREAKVIDCAPDSPHPEIFGTTSTSDFIKFNIKLVGPLDVDLVKVELIRLVLAESDDKCSLISINAGEEFLWRSMDVANRVLAAIEDMTGVLLILDWDEEAEEHVINVQNAAKETQTQIYSPPKSDKLFNIKKVEISPINLNVTFLRAPQNSRYNKLTGRGSAMMNYFTKRLKFKIKHANIKFDGYVANNINGPPDRVVEQVTAVYIRRVKMQLLMLMSAVSIQDWKVLASRKGGADEYVEGDVLRITGNALGNTAGYVLKAVTAGIGDGVINLTGAIGGRFKTATKKVGLGALGHGVNSVVTGVGGGVGSAVKGVGLGAGSLIKGTGKGAGQIVGGITGGAEHITKGIGKGIADRDSQALLDGLNKGISSAAGGFGEGVETAAHGAVNAAWHVGDGVFSGAKHVGEGFGGLFDCCSYPNEEIENNFCACY